MRSANAIPDPDDPRHDIAELGNIMQKLSALGDREWVEDILLLARKRLQSVRRAIAESAEATKEP